MLDLPCLNQLLYGSRDILDWDIWVEAVLVKQIDCFHVQAPKGAFDGPRDVLRLAVSRARLTVVELKAELARDDDLVPERC